jgi:hypothetical protein
VDGAHGGGMAGVKNAKQVRPKQSTVNGEAQAKLVAALIAHHDYGNGSVLKWEPIGNNELARKAKVAPGSATAFFKEHFGDGGHANYRRACSNNDGRLAIVLGKVSGDLNTAKLFELRDSDGATDTDDADE